METLSTIRANHATRCNLSSYQDGWNDTERAIQADYPTLDVVTVRIYAHEATKRANSHDPNTHAHVHALGCAARWLAVAP